MQEGTQEAVAEQVVAVDEKPTEAGPQVVGTIEPKEQTIAERTKVADAKVALPLAPSGQSNSK